MGKPPPVRYIDQLIGELDQIQTDYLTVLESSSIRPTNYPSNFIGFAHSAWTPSSEELQAQRMALLARLRDLEPRFLLLFPHPTPEIAKRHEEAFKQLDRWLTREDGDHSLPGSIPAAVDKIRASVAALRAGKDAATDRPLRHPRRRRHQRSDRRPRPHPVHRAAGPALPGPPATRCSPRDR